MFLFDFLVWIWIVCLIGEIKILLLLILLVLVVLIIVLIVVLIWLFVIMILIFIFGRKFIMYLVLWYSLVWFFWWLKFLILIIDRFCMLVFWRVFLILLSLNGLMIVLIFFMCVIFLFCLYIGLEYFCLGVIIN